MKVFHVPWNASENVFHEIPWKKSFTVYTCLKKSHSKKLQLAQSYELIVNNKVFRDKNNKLEVKQRFKFKYI